MRKVTTWHPDTCECILHYEWDTNDPQETRVHTPVEHVVTSEGTIIPHKKCEAHKHHKDHHSLTHACWEETQRKNTALDKILRSHEHLQKKEIDGNGNESVTFHPHLTPDWHFDENRNLRIKTKGLQQPDKDTLADHFNKKHGKDKVQIS